MSKFSGGSVKLEDILKVKVVVMGRQVREIYHDVFMQDLKYFIFIILLIENWLAKIVLYFIGKRKKIKISIQISKHD